MVAFDATEEPFREKPSSEARLVVELDGCCLGMADLVDEEDGAEHQLADQEGECANPSSYKALPSRAAVAVSIRLKA